MKFKEIFSTIHNSTNRNYIGRMVDEKVECMNVACDFGKDYWDGDRRFGYGGYKYDGRWKNIAEKLIDLYSISSESYVVDLGCGMGHLLYEIQQLSKCRILGVDISQYAKDNALIDKFEVCDLREFNFSKIENADLILSIMTLHNFEPQDVKSILKQISNANTNTYITMESYRNNKELFNLQCWALTCSSFLSPEGWEWILKESSYEGDYELLYFE